MAKLSILWCTLVTTAYAQLPLEQWPEKLKAFYTVHNPVKLHLQFNQPAYAPGDTAFFRAAYLLAADGAPLKGYNLIELDVVDASGKTVLHQVFRIRDGWGSNQLMVPTDMPPGTYRVFVYDNWMKNFGRSRYFAGELQVAGEYAYSTALVKEKPACYPEGGQLVAGVRNKVVVYAAAANNQNGFVTDASGKQIATFITDSNGYGLFFITPDKDEIYTVSLNGQANQLVAARDGVSIMVTPAVSAKSQHRVLLQAPALSDLRNAPLHLLISGHGLVYYSATFSFQDKEFINLAIPAEALGHGICYLTVNSRDGETLASRIIFNKKSAVKISVKPDKPSYPTRTPAAIEVSVSDDTNNPVLARMAVSVYQQAIFPSIESSSRQTDQYLLVVADLDKPLPPGFDANLQTAEGLHLLDRVLITNSWPWYTWENVLDKQTKPQFLFRDFLQVNGRLVEHPSGKPFTDSVSITFFVMGAQDVYEVFSRNDGTFRVSFLLPFYSSEKIFYRVERAGRRIDDVRLELTDSLNHYAALPLQRTATGNPYYRYAQMRNRINTSYRYFSAASNRTPEVISRNVLIEKELFEPDVAIDLDDYTLFPTMQETLHEIVPYLQYRKIAGRDVVRLYLPEQARAGMENPAFIIDGVLTDDASYFLKLKPAEVAKIKLIYTAPKLAKLGAISRNGIVLVETKIENNAANVAATSRLFSINGITPAMPVNNSSFTWQKANPRAPQLKSCLFWNPLIRSNENGMANFSFTTTDETGRFVIRIEGLTVEGVPFVYEEYLDVSYSKGN
ncbi:MAG: hypothetical protein HRU69_05870 [Flammeovirgaceae bacterium]|nr:MAG: hypothetical protein HRU69_05870 [Flammeovirgaceae bacterium]